MNLGTHAQVNHRTGRKTKAASVPHTKFSEAREPLLRPQNDARASGQAGERRVQGRVAAGRSVIPTDKRGSLSRAHKAAGSRLGLGRLHRSAGPGEVARTSSAAWASGASSAPRPPSLPRRAAPRPVRSNAGTR